MKTRLLGFAAAAVALAVLGNRIGLAEIAAQFTNLGTVLPIVLLAGAVRLLLQTYAWGIALRADGILVPYPRLFAVRLASQAAGYLTVLGPVASEPAKLVLLRNPRGTAEAVPATLAETGTYWFTGAVLGLVGACAAAFLVGDARFLLGAALLFGIALALLVTPHSVLSPLVRRMGPRAPKWLQSAEAAELRIRSFRDRQPEAAKSVLALDAIAQLVTLAEVVGVLSAADLRWSVPHALAIEAASRAAKVLGAWIPGRIGVDEGGAAVSFALLGFPAAAGLMLVLARRLRDLLSCGIGVLWAATSKIPRPAPVHVSSRVSICLEEN